MYNVLIVDDETIILSGIKYMINWEKNDCTIIGTASNGQEALEKIRAFPPDIVLCDIKMPVLSGIELLKIVNEEFPSVVFIMLTNFQEFDLARDSLFYRAADYLIKGQLDVPVLENSLQKAKEESDRRSLLSFNRHMDYYEEKNRHELIQNALLDSLFSADSSRVQKSITLLHTNHVLKDYGLIYMPMEFSEYPDINGINSDEKKKLLAYEQEVLDKLAFNILGGRHLFVQTEKNDSLTLFIWNQSAPWEDKIRLFSRKASSASRNITLLSPIVLATDLFHEPEQFAQCREQFFCCVELFYLGSFTSSLCPSTAKRPAFMPLGLKGIGSQLDAELNSRNLTGCLLLLDKAILQVQSIPHQKSQAIWLCNELFRSVSKFLQTNGFPSPLNYSEIENLLTREQVISWMERLKNVLSDCLGEQANLTSRSINMARQYVVEHIESHISLQDVADYVSMSPGYLSTLFKKQCGQSFISFVNQIKIERACQMLRDENYRIKEISGRLGYDNPYYFSKVFRRYTGTTPSAYAKRPLE